MAGKARPLNPCGETRPDVERFVLDEDDLDDLVDEDETGDVERFVLDEDDDDLVGEDETDDSIEY